MNEREFQAAYRALIEQDAQVKAPDRLRVDVMARWEDERRARSSRARSITASVRGLVAAAVVLIVAGVVGHYRHLGDSPPTTVPARGVQWASSVTGRLGVNPVVRLVADPRFETESLQIVRLRVHGASLELFGVELRDSDQSGLVEVDVLVGSDGLPREIRSIEEVVRDTP